LAPGNTLITRRRRFPDAEAAHGDDADLFVVLVAKLLAQCLAVGKVCGIEAGDRPGEM
jgi:hypothetical protein